MPEASWGTVLVTCRTSAQGTLLQSGVSFKAGYWVWELGGGQLLSPLLGPVPGSFLRQDATCKSEVRVKQRQLGGQADHFLARFGCWEWGGRRQERDKDEGSNGSNGPVIESHVDGIKLLSRELPLMFPLGAWHPQTFCPSPCRSGGGDAMQRLRVGRQWWRVRCTGNCTGNQNALQAPTSVLFRSPHAALNFLPGATWQDSAKTETTSSPISYFQSVSCGMTMILPWLCWSTVYLRNRYGLGLKMLRNNESTTSLSALFQWLNTPTVKNSYTLFQTSVSLSLCFRYLVILFFCLWFVFARLKHC